VETAAHLFLIWIFNKWLMTLERRNAGAWRRDKKWRILTSNFTAICSSPQSANPGTPSLYACRQFASRICVVLRSSVVLFQVAQLKPPQFIYHRQPYKNMHNSNWTPTCQENSEVVYFAWQLSLVVRNGSDCWCWLFCTIFFGALAMNFRKKKIVPYLFVCM